MRSRRFMRATLPESARACQGVFRGEFLLSALPGNNKGVYGLRFFLTSLKKRKDILPGKIEREQLLEKLAVLEEKMLAIARERGRIPPHGTGKGTWGQGRGGRDVADLLTCRLHADVAQQINSVPLGFQ